MNQHIAHHLPAYLISSLINLRLVALLIAEPIDRLGLLINGKKDLPPLQLRRFVGPLSTFEASGASWACMLKLLAKLKSNSSIWDIGCGCGLMALELRSYLFPEQGSRYLGSDIHKPSIKWCQRHIKQSNFAFIHHDIQNSSYNPRGKINPVDFSLDESYGRFDVIMAKSLFTHITTPMAKRYLDIIHDHLVPHGLCLVSSFLFNSVESSHGLIDFCYGGDQFRYAYKNRIESAVAYQKDFFIELVYNAGLELAHPIISGGWAHKYDGLNFQDIVLLKRR